MHVARDRTDLETPRGCAPPGAMPITVDQEGREKGSAMKPIRLTSVVFVSLLLLAPAPAWAECAWVLWVYGLAKSAEEYSIDSAHTTKRECDAAVRHYADTLRKKGFSVTGGFVGATTSSGKRGIPLSNISASPTPWTRAGRRKGRDDSSA